MNTEGLNYDKISQVYGALENTQCRHRYTCKTKVVSVKVRNQQPVFF